MVIPAPTGGFKNREDMAQKFCPGKVTAEVGVLYGAYSKFMLAQKPTKHYMIDPWKKMPDFIYPGWGNMCEYDLNAGFAHVTKEFSRRPDVVILRETSFQAAMRFPNDTLDFCFIDACHTTPMVLADSILWWPKVKKGGILAGHDLNLGPPYLGEVPRALEHFLYMIGRERLDIVTDQQDSWGVVK